LCGNKLSPVPTLETDITYPNSIYASTKLSQENLVRIACDSKDIKYSILRLQNVYGEGQSLNNPYTGLLSIFSTKIRLGLELPVFEDGLESRDFIHVDDVVSAIEACISDHPDSNIINVGSGVATSILSVANNLMNALGVDVPVRLTGEYRLGDIRHNLADVTRLQALNPNGPKITLVDGLNRFAHWVKLQPIPDDNLSEANLNLKNRNLMRD
jgi:dTDP-L-rhamnose 4-epimerase